MRAVVQRTLSSQVTSEGVVTGAIKRGLTVLLGVAPDDDERDVAYMVDKLVHMRIFEDEQGKMNISVQDIQGSILVISQFTLYGDLRHGRRPGFTGAAPPEVADKWYQRLIDALRATGLTVETGKFQTEMLVTLENDGPVTILLDSKKIF
ncbi:D-aminoacyl-tRNA deacylase [Megasphaera hutchinsoni]|uniref:D-aminoacyl-tRNA deacylase n=1 Tax=Megasphaera hutchinsoni TaxID=1588748 RepID=A0A2J8BC52_9FIRM|nr:D-aminoacyl-tRNA deacylase [Megasphaera genomosp. type_2]PNH22321.1 D-tyrosyl-tRNA(Tyr) deacylase [Megasphaera genomosp. type_2]